MVYYGSPAIFRWLVIYLHYLAIIGLYLGVIFGVLFYAAILVLLVAGNALLAFAVNRYYNRFWNSYLPGDFEETGEVDGDFTKDTLLIIIN